MDCQECHQRPATLHFTQLINGKKIDTHICEVCAKELGYMTHPEEGYSLHNLLAGLFNFESNQLKNNKQSNFKQEIELKCPKCDLKFTEFKRIGKFGCAECYHTFSKQIDSIFRRVHSGNTKHEGKIPKRQGDHLHVKKQLETYENQLKQLIEREEFEEAAVVRDKIRAVKSGYGKLEAGDSSDTE